MIQYHILKDGEIIHTSSTAFTNKEQLVHVLINQLHTPIEIVVGYLKDPSHYTVIPTSEYQQEKPKRKPRQTQKTRESVKKDKGEKI